MWTTRKGCWRFLFIICTSMCKVQIMIVILVFKLLIFVPQSRIPSLLTCFLTYSHRSLRRSKIMNNRLSQRYAFSILHRFGSWFLSYYQKLWITDLGLTFWASSSFLFFFNAENESDIWFIDICIKSRETRGEDESSPGFPETWQHWSSQVFHHF